MTLSLMPEISEPRCKKYAHCFLTLRRPAGMQELSRESAQSKHVAVPTNNILLYFCFSFNDRAKKRTSRGSSFRGGVDRSRTYQ